MVALTSEFPGAPRRWRRHWARRVAADAYRRGDYQFEVVSGMPEERRIWLPGDK